MEADKCRLAIWDKETVAPAYNLQGQEGGNINKGNYPPDSGNC